MNIINLSIVKCIRNATTHQDIANIAEYLLSEEATYCLSHQAFNLIMKELECKNNKIIANLFTINLN